MTKAELVQTLQEDLNVKKEIIALQAEKQTPEDILVGPEELRSIHSGIKPSEGSD